MSGKQRGLSRDEKAKNLVMNYSMIMMGVFEGVFTELTSKMSEALVAGTTAMAEALAGGASVPDNKPHDEMSPKLKRGVNQLFSEMRNQVAAELPADQSFKEFIRDPAFNEGIRIVESHEFKLPKLTEPLSDDDLAGYMTLLGGEDPELGKVFQELSEWQKKVPKPNKGGR